MSLYREWTTLMYPYAPHEEVMKKVERLKKTREVRACIAELKERDRIANGGDPADAPAPEEDGDVVDGEDVFFPDEDSDDDVPGHEGKEVEEEEEEWNAAKHAGDEEEEEDDDLAALMETERGGGGGDDDDDAGAAAAAKKKKKKKPRGPRETDEEMFAREEARADEIDRARREGAVDVNFDESSSDDDDDDVVIAAPRSGRGARGDAATRGKAVKKIKEKVGGRKKSKKTLEKEAAAAEKFAAEKAEAEAADPTRRKKLGRARANASDDDDDDDDDAGAAAAEDTRRRRRVTAIDDSDSDSESDPRTRIPAENGGDLFVPSPSKYTVPKFLYESDGGDDVKEMKEEEDPSDKAEKKRDAAAADLGEGDKA